MAIAKVHYEEPKILIAIPAYNEERYIGDVVKKAKAYGAEVLVVDDASTDNTSKVATRAGATIVRHEINKRYGGAIKSCFKYANGKNADILVVLDGDGQHNPIDIKDIIKPLLKNEADLVIGSRFLNYSNKIPAYRKFGIGVITFLFNVFSNEKVTDSQSGFRAYNRKAIVLGPFNEGCMGISIEIILKARLSNLRIKEVPISVLYHEESSTINPIVHGLSVALTVLKLRLKMLVGRSF